MKTLLITLLLLGGAAHAEEATEVEAAQALAKAEQARAAAAEARRLALDEAFQREFAWLASESKALTQQLAAFEERSRGQRAGADQELEALQSRLVALTLRGDQQELTLTDLDSQLGGREEDSDRLASALEQAEQTLGASARGEMTPAERVTADFTKAVALLNQAGAVRSEEDSFFATDGVKVAGTVLHVGSIARFGASDAASGALVPAGDGRWKLAAGPGAAVAQALHAGERPAQAGLFLVENPDQAVVEETAKTVSDVLDDGGTIGWVIVALGAIAALLLLLRLLMLAVDGTRSGALATQVELAIREGRIDALAHEIAELKNTGARVFHRVLHADFAGREEREEILSESMLDASAHMSRWAVPVQVIAAVAPLLGLLGTVTGMIATFDVITKFGTGDPKMLSGGISAALVTTELGLIVAIPCLLIGALLTSRADSLLDRVERAALEALRWAAASETVTGVTAAAHPNGEPRAPELAPNA